MAAFPLTALSLCVHHLHKHVVRGVEPTLDMWREILLIEFGLQVRNEQRSDLKRCACCHWCMIWLFSVRIRLTSVLLLPSVVHFRYEIGTGEMFHCFHRPVGWCACPGFIFCLFHACMIAHNNVLSYIIYMCIICKHLKLYSYIQQDALCVCLPFSKAFLTAIMACCASRCSSSI